LGRRLDSTAVFRYHRHRLRTYGAGGPQALGWNGAASQHARFEALTRIGDLAQRSVLDAGCGYADLYPYLRQRYAGVRYYGIEQVPELLEVAQARYPEAEDITLRSGDFLREALPPTDYVLAGAGLQPAELGACGRRPSGLVRSGQDPGFLSPAGTPSGTVGRLLGRGFHGLRLPLSRRILVGSGWSSPDQYTPRGACFGFSKLSAATGTAFLAPAFGTTKR
jgi:hypothetical protein